MAAEQEAWLHDVDTKVDEFGLPGHDEVRRPLFLSRRRPSHCRTCLTFSPPPLLAWLPGWTNARPPGCLFCLPASSSPATAAPSPPGSAPPALPSSSAAP